MTGARFTLLGMLTAQAVLLAWTAAAAAPTADEPAHLVGGLFSWRYGRFDLYVVNPPLVELIAAAPVAWLGSELDWSSLDLRPGERSQWRVGGDWLAANGRRGLRLLFLARCAVIPLVVVGGLGCYRWARDLYGADDRRAGRAAGLLACGAWSFNPTLLTHGALITPDAVAASAGVWAGYTFWRFARQPAGGTATAAGWLLGAALLTKTTWAILFAVWPVLWLFRPRPAGVAPGRPPKTGRRAAAWGLLAAAMLTGLYLLNAGYGFRGTGSRLGEYRFVSRTLTGFSDAEAAAGADATGNAVGNRFAGTGPGMLPVPVPSDWLSGVDVQRRDFENPHRAYLFGEWRRGGWTRYYLAALAVKEPIGLFALAVLAGLAAAVRPSAGLRGELLLLVPPLAVLVLVSSQTNLNQHPRYLLPAYGFAFVWCGQAARGWGTDGPGALSLGRRRLWAAAVGTAGLLAVAEVAPCLPHPHAFFNTAAGGPMRGHERLSHSALDWGQSVRGVADWHKSHPHERLDGAALVGRPLSPAFDLPAADVPPSPRPGVWALAANVLAEPAFAQWRDLRPVAVVGGNARIYRVGTTRGGRPSGRPGQPPRSDEIGIR